MISLMSKRRINTPLARPRGVLRYSIRGLSSKKGRGVKTFVLLMYDIESVNGDPD